MLKYKVLAPNCQLCCTHTQCRRETCVFERLAKGGNHLTSLARHAYYFTECVHDQRYIFSNCISFSLIVGRKPQKHLKKELLHMFVGTINNLRP